jgi:hypothetical protein
MHQFRHITQLVIVAICLLWGGQQVTSDVLAQPGEQSAVVSETEKDIEAQYPELPAAVAHSIQSVVATQQLLNDETNQGLVASGVVINDQQFVTAGHTVGGDGRLASLRLRLLAIPSAMPHSVILLIPIWRY